MGVGPDSMEATQVAIFEPRRLIRQAMCVWLSSQKDVKLAAATTSIITLAQHCQRNQVNVVLMSAIAADDSTERDIGALSKRYPSVRTVAICDEADKARIDQILARGFQDVVPTGGGVDALLRVIDAGASVRPISAPVATTSTGPLTPREAQVLSLVGQGSTADDISMELGISPSTIANHKERIFNKLDAKNQAHAVARAVNLGLISPGREEKPLAAG